ncbi:MAG: rhomboid family intramembrane serine protease [Sphingorhabdus sp.]|jgi:membrane associated rhomboid family serine protease|nr:rhomboid family intramembrane serine protease [Sphingorhabdus sp.]
MNMQDGKLTNGLVIANVVIFLLLWISGWQYDAVLRGGFFPIRWSGEGYPALESFGALVPAWLTPISSAFLHAGFLHIAFNMLMLIFCGRLVEQVLGAKLLAFLYVLGAYSAAVAEYLFNSQSVNPVIGASGAISAILAAYALLSARNEVKPIGPVPGYVVRIVWLTAAWIGIQFMIGIATYGGVTRIAIFAHIGGFVAGLIATRPLLLWRFKGA